MKFVKNCSVIVGLIATGVLLPFEAHATASPIGVPEPVSLALLAVGAAGVGAAALIRRGKDK